jgi:hypothetical protein
MVSSGFWDHPSIGHGTVLQHARNFFGSTHFMKRTITTSADASEPLVFPRIAHQLRETPKAAIPGAKVGKKKTGSQSRDIREDRGTRQIKTTQNTRTLSHGR